MRLHVELSGAGESVVLLHGFAGSARNFRPQVRALRGGYRVITFDARGHARSEAPAVAEAYTADCFVADLARVLDEAGAARAVVGGLSLGAGVALRFALAQRERVQGLVLASFPPGAGTGVAARAAEFARVLDTDGLEAAGARFVWGEGSGLAPRDAALVRQGFLEHDARALAHVLRELVAVQPSVEELAPALRRFERPALIVAGEADAPSVSAGKALAAALPRARLVVVAGAGHVVNLERPEAFNQALIAFLGEEVFPAA
jgi:pimeloyl-ACP methyl ester carboxylesterase